MESTNHADEGQLNIQNDYFNNARKNRMRVTVILMTGQRISGLIRSFDRFTLILDTRHGDQMVFKHAIATVAPAHAGERDHRGRPPRGQDRGEGRPPHRGGPPPSRDGGGPRGEGKPRGSSGPPGKGFGNFMDLSAVTGAGEKGAGPKPEEKPSEKGARIAASSESADGKPADGKPAEAKAEEAGPASPPAPASDGSSNGEAVKGAKAEAAGAPKAPAEAGTPES